MVRKLTIPFIDVFIPKYPEISTKQLTPIIEKHSINVFDIEGMLEMSCSDILFGNVKAAPVKWTNKIMRILTIRNNSIFDCRV